jgi:hypothetical protein
LRGDRYLVSQHTNSIISIFSNLRVMGFMYRATEVILSPQLVVFSGCGWSRWLTDMEELRVDANIRNTHSRAADKFWSPSLKAVCASDNRIRTCSMLRSTIKWPQTFDSRICNGGFCAYDGEIFGRNKITAFLHQPSNYHVSIRTTPNRVF